MDEPSDLRKEWIEEEKDRRSDTEGKRAKRRYIHFDSRLTSKVIEETKVWVPSFVTGHSFYPFIRYTIKTRRFKKAKRKFEPKLRNIDYAAHQDALIFSWYAFLLSKRYEEIVLKNKISRNVTAYRKNIGSNLEFAKRVFDFILEKSECAVICLDVTNFFPSLDHQILKKNLCVILGVERLPEDYFYIYKTITRFSFVTMEKVTEVLGLKKKDRLLKLCGPEEFRKKIEPLISVNKKLKGIPQGSPISAVLSNVYMLDFDTDISTYIQKFNGLYQRYCDDIILVFPKEDFETIEAYVMKEILNIKLKINPSKVEKRYFSKRNGKLECIDYETGKKINLKYLGIEFDGQRTYIRHNGVARYQKKLKQTVKKAERLLRSNKRTAFPKNKIYKKFYPGKKSSNFPSYVKRASVVFLSDQIKKQLSSFRIIKKIKEYRAGKT
jgi:RNA-directed DNA polymerase